VQRKKSSKSHPLQDEPWPPNGGSFNGKRRKPPDTEAVLFSNGSMDLVFRRFRITGVVGSENNKYQMGQIVLKKAGNSQRIS